MNLAAQWDHDRDLHKHWLRPAKTLGEDGCPDDPDGWRDEAEDKESTDAERDDREGVPVVDSDYGARFGDFIGE
jgi:hypothetical protein